MNTNGLKSDLRARRSDPGRDWGDPEARLNQFGTQQEQVDRLAQATRFEWSSANCPKHD